MGKYTDVFTPVGVTGGLHLRYNDPMTKKKKHFAYMHKKFSVALKAHRKKCKRLIL